MYYVLAVTGQRFVITPRLLDYGTYMIRMNASMYRTDGINMSAALPIPDTQSSLVGFFQVKPCDIQAKIKGGNGKAVSYEGETVKTPTMWSICFQK